MRFPATLLPAALVAALCAATPAWAQLYRSVGPDGRVTYSDTPPTAASTRGGGSSDSGGETSSALPYALAQIAQKYPVTLYTNQGCAPCTSGRNLLIRRGIPFTEKTVDSNDDVDALKKIAGSTSMPLLTIGGQQLSGFQENNWSQYLSAAGYPQTSQLPSGYHPPLATQLAPQAAATARAASGSPAAVSVTAPAGGVPVVPPTDPSNPTGIRF